MNILSGLTKHKVVEINRAVALLSGHMVAQAPYRQVDAETYLDNGAILFLNSVGELTLAGEAGAQLGQPFLHYTEELMDGPVVAYEYFTVDLVDGVCYPRALAMYEGDEFTTNNIAGVIPATGVKKFAILVAGVLTIVDAIPVTAYKGPLFVVERDKLPAGQLAVHLTLINRNLVVTV